MLLLAATNRPEVLDKALLRPGRISRRIVVPLPDTAGRAAILKTHMRSKPMESAEYKERCTQHLATVTPGFSGTLLSLLCVSTRATLRDACNLLSAQNNASAYVRA